MTLDRSPEYLFKTSYLLYLLNTYHPPGETLVGPFLSPELYLEQFKIWSTQ